MTQLNREKYVFVDTWILIVSLQSILSKKIALDTLLYFYTFATDLYINENIYSSDKRLDPQKGISSEWYCMQTSGVKSYYISHYYATPIFKKNGISRKNSQFPYSMYRKELKLCKENTETLISHRFLTVK